jgi:hypothetical protein
MREGVLSSIKIDKIASVTVNLKLEREAEIAESGRTGSGDVCVVRALEEKRVYDQLELVTGRMAKISKGDVIAGAFGARRALKGFAGSVPARVKKGDVLNVLNLGGVIGKAVSFNRDYGEPLRVELLGLALRNGKVLNIKEGARPLADRIMRRVPLVAVSGTSMNSGKTEALAKTVQELTWKGYRVCAAKVTGVSALRDTLNMADHGALKALSFLDFGYPSTVGLREVPSIAKGAVNELLASDPDVIMVELGDGLLGEYGVFDFFRDKEILSALTCNIVCAIDPVGAWGMHEILKANGVPVHLVSGPVTDNDVGVEFVKSTLGVEAINALSRQEKVGLFVEKMVREKGRR